MKVLILLVVWFASAWAQAPTVFIKVASAAAGDGTFHYSTVIPNIGQSTHQIYGKLTTCNPASNTGSLLMYANSADAGFGTGANQIPLAISSSFTDASGIVNATASGVYPTLVVAYSSPVGCTFSVYYSGTIGANGVGLQKVTVTDTVTGTNDLKVKGGSAVGVDITGSNYLDPVITAGLTRNLTSGLAQASNIFACDKLKNVSITAGSTIELLGKTPAFNAVICSMLLTGSAANTTVTFSTGTKTTTPCDTTGVTLGGAFNIGTGILNQGSGVGTIMVSPATKDICIAAGTGNVTGIIMYSGG